MSIDTGSRLGPYEILAPIGAGGMGEVYKARDTRLSRNQHPRLPYVTTAALGAVMTLSAQAPTPPPQTPVFRAEVAAVTVDVRVVDKDGAFVRDLSVDDFIVYEDDVPQPITAFTFVDIPNEPSTAPMLAGTPVVRDVVSNDKDANGRLYVLVLDDAGGSPFDTTAVQKIATAFIERYFTDADRMAIVTTSGRSEVTRQFTNERIRLLEAVKRFQGGFGIGANAPHLLEHLTHIADWMGSFTARRKAVIVISGQADLGFNDDAIEARADSLGAARQLLTAAARGNVTLYSIDPHGNPSQPAMDGIKPAPEAASFDMRSGAGADSSGPPAAGGIDLTARYRRAHGGDDFGSLADQTGGFILANSNDFVGAIARVVSENSSYYLLSYTVPNDSTAKTFRRIRVQIRRPDLTVRARSGYIPGPPPPPLPANTTAVMPPTLTAMLRSGVPVPGLTLHVSSPTYRAEKNKGAADVIVEASGGDLLFTPDGNRFNGSMQLVVAVVNYDGRVLVGQKGDLTMRLLPGTHGSVTERGIRLLSHFVLSPGLYQLRVGATDAGGGTKFGSVQYDLVVPKFDDRGVSLGSIALQTTADRTMVTRGSIQPWQQRSDLVPTARRQFAATDTVSVYTEIYSNKGRARDSITATVLVQKESGEVVYRQERTFAAERGNEPWLTHPLTLPLPVSDLPPGRYVLSVRAVNSSDGKHPVHQNVAFTMRR